MFTAKGDVVQAAEILYKKPILIERGSFRPVTNVTLDMLECARAQFLQEPKLQGRSCDGRDVASRTAFASPLRFAATMKTTFRFSRAMSSGGCEKETSWEQLVPGDVARIIKERSLFGWHDENATGGTSPQVESAEAPSASELQLA